MFNKVILIGRLGQNAETRTAQNNREYTILNVATHESWKNDKGDYETRTEWHRVFAWGKLSRFAGTLEKGQLVTLEGVLRYREVESVQHGKQRLAEVQGVQPQDAFHESRLWRIQQTANQPMRNSLQGQRCCPCIACVGARLCDASWILRN